MTAIVGRSDEDEMVERMAEAHYDRDGQFGPWRDMDDDKRDEWRLDMHAALDALPPTALAALLDAWRERNGRESQS